MKVRVAVLISGNGSNLQALIDASTKPEFPAEIVLVISNKADAYGLKRAEHAGIPTIIINHKDFTSRDLFDARIHEALVAHHIEVVCLAGFMRLLTLQLVNAWKGKMINIHPSLLPAYKGVDAIGQAFDAGEKTTGVTVHYVTEEMDTGEIIIQEALDILPNDTKDSLTERVHAIEHSIYPQALSKVIYRLQQADSHINQG